MNLAIAMLGAIGLVVFASGLPTRTGVRLSRRVDPYLSGLRGRPSALLSTAANSSRPARYIARVLRSVLPLSNDLQDRLQRAGDMRPPEAFRIEQVTWACVGVALAGAWFVLLVALGASPAPISLPVLATLGATIGFLGRDRMLQRQIQATRERANEELPTAVDLIALCVMAGESIPAACERVAKAMPRGIGEEFGRVVADVRAGSPATEALAGLAGRSDDPALSRLVDALCTGIERGTPLANVLRAQADDARDARRRKLMEVAGRKEVLMLVPVVFLIMPVVVVFALYPGLVSLRLLVP